MSIMRNRTPLDLDFDWLTVPSRCCPRVFPPFLSRYHTIPRISPISICYSFSFQIACLSGLPSDQTAFVLKWNLCVVHRIPQIHFVGSTFFFISSYFTLSCLLPFEHAWTGSRVFPWTFHSCVLLSKIKATSLLLPFWLCVRMPSLVFVYWQFLRLAPIALFSQYMNCAVSNRLLNVCHCFSLHFSRPSFSRILLLFSLYAKRYSHQPFLSGYSRAIPLSFLSVANLSFMRFRLALSSLQVFVHTVMNFLACLDTMNRSLIFFLLCLSCLLVF